MTNSETLHENRVHILGTGSDIVSNNSAIDIIKLFLNSSYQSRKFVIYTPNPEIVVDAYKDVEFRNAINEADLLLVDGKGLQLAIAYTNGFGSNHSRLLMPLLGLYQGLSLMCHTFLGKKLYIELNNSRTEVTKVSGVDFVNELISQMAGKTFYFVGTRYQSGHESADEAFKALQKANGSLKMVGSTSCRRFNAELGKFEDITFADVKAKILLDMAKSGVENIDFLVVGTGHKRQELWIQSHKNELPAKVFLGVGGTFDFIRGSKSRAPLFVQNLGLEWLFRLTQEPTTERFFRILKAFPYFPILVYIDSLTLTKKH